MLYHIVTLLTEKQGSTISCSNFSNTVKSKKITLRHIVTLTTQ